MAHILKARVAETSTSTGTGDITLAGAVTGFSTFTSRYSTGDVLYYEIHGASSIGIPTGEWEVGIGTYSAANTLTRTTVLSSSNSDALVNFSAGDKRVSVTMTAFQGEAIREKLTAARTYYVRTDGSNSNTGLANTSGGAFLTIQKAIDVASYTLDMNSYAVTIQVGDGTYTAGFTTRPLIGASGITVQGNSGTPANVLISTTSASGASSGVSGVSLTVKDMKIMTTTAGNSVQSSNGGVVNYSNIDFGACAGNHVHATGGGRISCVGNYAISGGAASHFFANGYGYIQCANRTITLSGTPAFSAYFAGCNTPGGIECFGCTFSGTGATGTRYSFSANGVGYTGGGGANYFPGNVAGSTATGGQYV